MSVIDMLYNCGFCGVAYPIEFMYWVQGAESWVDKPNCCADCVEDEDDESDDESDDDEELRSCDCCNAESRYSNLIEKEGEYICYECEEEDKRILANIEAEEE
jgi:hypothetical protein